MSDGCLMLLLQVVPEEDWYCPNCRCAICGGSQFNGSHDTFDEMSVLFCDQCERECELKLRSSDHQSITPS